MSQIQYARQLAEYVMSLTDFSMDLKPRITYDHMGAVITDTILQAGLNYRTVVEPRVKNVIAKYPEASVTSKFFELINLVGVKRILNWNHSEKINRVIRITTFFLNSEIETEYDLRNWLIKPEASFSLLNMKGIGPKTVDYIKNLVGIPSVAVDRHIRNFVVDAGISHKDYDEIRSTVEYAADLLDVPRNIFDHAIWQYRSKKEMI